MGFPTFGFYCRNPLLAPCLRVHRGCRERFEAAPGMLFESLLGPSLCPQIGVYGPK